MASLPRLARCIPLLLLALVASCTGPTNTDGVFGASGTSPISEGSSSSPTTHHHHHTSPTPTPSHHHHHHHHHHSTIPTVDYPNHALTPGATFAVGVSRICTPGYASSVRDVSDTEKAAVYHRYGVAWVPYQHEVDHLVSLELGGSNAITNLWPEPYAGRWGARTKDVLEDRLHDLVCAGELSLASAQHQEATDWVTAYRRYVGKPPGGGGAGGSTSPGGYYASSYPTASTIYCADDPLWRNLSPTYLVHFDTLAEALARFPTYHLHQPC